MKSIGLRPSTPEEGGAGLPRRIPGPALGPLFLHVRRKHGLDQEALARKLGYSARSVSRWETGQVTPRAAQRRKIAVVLGPMAPELAAELTAALGFEVIAPATAAAPQAPARDPEATARELHGAVRACADELDVTARRLRIVLADLLGVLNELGVSAAVARELLATSS